MALLFGLARYFAGPILAYRSRGAATIRYIAWTLLALIGLVGIWGAQSVGFETTSGVLDQPWFTGPAALLDRMARLGLLGLVVLMIGCGFYLNLAKSRWFKHRMGLWGLWPDLLITLAGYPGLVLLAWMVGTGYLLALHGATTLAQFTAVPDYALSHWAGWLGVYDYPQTGSLAAKLVVVVGLWYAASTVAVALIPLPGVRPRLRIGLAMLLGAVLGMVPTGVSWLLSGAPQLSPGT